MVGASPALAATEYPYLSQINGSATALGSFNYVISIASDDFNGDTYVADYDYETGANVVYVFATSTGGYLETLDGSNTPAGSFGGRVSVAADNATGEVYVADAGDEVVDILSSSGAYVGQFDGSGTPAGSFNPQSIAVDQSTGDVYVGDSDSDVVDVFSSSGAYVSQITGASTPAGFFYPAGVAVDATTGDVFVADNTNKVVDEFDSSGTWVATWDGSGTPAGSFGTGQVTDAVDDATGDVFVTDGTDNVVDAFDSAGDYLGQITGTPSGAFSNVQGVNVDQASGDEYVSDQGNEVIDVFGAGVLVPDVTTGQASGVTTTGATLNGTVNPDGTTLTGCEFQYVPDAEYDASAADPYSAGSTAACSSTPSGSSPVAVSASVSGLTPGALYHFRLEAGNANGTNDGVDQTFATGAVIGGESVGAVGTQSATLNAEVNPYGLDTTYQFQYGSAGPCSASACTSVPATPADIGSGTSAVAVSQQLTGLSPGVTYYWRVVASNTIGTAGGAEQTFTTQTAATPPAGSCPNAQYRIDYGAYLPDCRAYEQATPVDKDGGDVLGYPNLVQAAAGGDGITFFTTSGFPGATGAQDYPLFLASRGTGGWSTQGIDAPQSDGQGGEVEGWTPDLAYTFDVAAEGTGSGSLGSEFLERDNATGAVRTIVPYTVLGSVDSGYEGNGYYYAAASSDDSQVLFEDSGGDPLTGAATTSDNVYLWDASTGKVAAVGVLPDGSTPAGGSFAGPYDWENADQSVGGALRGYYTQTALSSDGSDAFFTAAADAGEDNGTDQVFVRENPMSADASTIEVSASQKTNGTGPGGSDPNGPQPAAFMQATPSGSEVLFTSGEELTNDADTGSGDQGNDLYAYDVSSGALSDLSLPNAGVTNSDPNGAEVQGVLGMSDDGSYVYFVANGVLAQGATRGDCNGSPNRGLTTSGTCNLYLWHDGSVTFIAEMTASYGGSPDQLNWQPSGTTTGGFAVPKTAQVTASGQTLLFSSQESLTGYDNGGYSELYRYQAASGTLTCVSCNPSGAAATSNAAEQSSIPSGAEPPPPASLVTRNLSSSGDQVFFNSSDPLLAQDSDGVQNVYEWEAAGAGSCTSSSQDGGCLYSISSGQSPDPSYLADASASGDDVFFYTDQQLVGQDTDQLYDIYDARVDGGLASQWPAAVTTCDSSAACEGSPSSPSPSTPAATVTFIGPKNETPATRTVSTAKVEVTRKAPRGSEFTLSVKVPAKGRVTITGAEVKRVSKSVSRAGTYKLVVKLTAKTKRRLKDRRKLRVAVKVAYEPGSGKSSSATVAVELKA